MARNKATDLALGDPFEGRLLGSPQTLIYLDI